MTINIERAAYCWFAAGVGTAYMMLLQYQGDEAGPFTAGVVGVAVLFFTPPLLRHAVRRFKHDE